MRPYRPVPGIDRWSHLAGLRSAPIEAVLHQCARESEGPDLTAPMRCEIGGQPYVAGTNGQRLLVVRVSNTERDTTRHWRAMPEEAAAAVAGFRDRLAADRHVQVRGGAFAAYLDRDDAGLDGNTATPPGHIARIGPYLFDVRLIDQVLADAEPDDVLALGPGSERDPLLLGGRGWFAAVMPLGRSGKANASVRWWEPDAACERSEGHPHSPTGDIGTASSTFDESSRENAIREMGGIGQAIGRYMRSDGIIDNLRSDLAYFQNEKRLMGSLMSPAEVGEADILLADAKAKLSAEKTRV